MNRNYTRNSQPFGLPADSSLEARDLNPSARTSVSTNISRSDARSETGRKLATTVYITEEQQALLKELNRRSRVPIAEYIREGIDLVLERHRALLPGQLAFGSVEPNAQLPNSQNSSRALQEGSPSGRGGKRSAHRDSPVVNQEEEN